MGSSSLSREGMQMESAARGGAEIAGETLNKLGKYSYNKIINRQNTCKEAEDYEKNITCYNCGNIVKGSIIKHREHCPARSVECRKCSKMGHFAKVCNKGKTVHRVRDNPYEQITPQTTNDSDDSDDSATYNVNLFRIKTYKVKP